jgi:hypothetical protein
MKRMPWKQKVEVHNCGKSGATIPKYTASYDKKVREPLKEIDAAERGQSEVMACHG